MKDESLANTGLVGGGFGYRFNNSFRSDFTVDYEWESQFKGKLNCPDPCTGKPGKEYSKEYADIAAWSGLVNAYWDFDLGGEGLAGFIPYVGAGVGVSSLTTSNVKYTNPNGTTGTWKGATTTNLAWALMAGVSVPVSNNWLIDLNYRYIDLGNAQSGKTLPRLRQQADQIRRHHRVGSPRRPPLPVELGGSPPQAASGAHRKTRRGPPPPRFFQSLHAALGRSVSGRLLEVE